MALKKTGSLENLVGEYNDYDKSSRYFSPLDYHEWLDPSSKYLNLLARSEYNKIPKGIREYNRIPKRSRRTLIDIYSSKNCVDRAFLTYKQNILLMILAADRDVLPILVHKFLRVSEVLSLGISSDEDVNLYYEILNCLISKGCQDPSAISDLLKTCISVTTRTAVFSNLIGERRIPNAGETMNYVLEMARRAKFNFWNLLDKEPIMQNLKMCPVTMAILRSDIEQITLLMKYGFKLTYPRIEAYRGSPIPAFEEVHQLLKGPLEATTPRRSIVICDIILFLLHYVCISCSRSRLIMIWGFRLLWSTITEPFVTQQELRTFLHRRFENNESDFDDMDVQILPDVGDHLFSVIKLYDRLYIREPVLIKPRSLRHLCKCSIRDQLRNNFNLPNGVYDLPLPPRLKSYLMLENI